MKAEYPRLDVVRRLKKDGALYYGPYVPAGGMWETARADPAHLPACDVQKGVQKGQARAALRAVPDRQMHGAVLDGSRCSRVPGHGRARCGCSSKGKNRDLLDMLKQRMEEASEKMEYERAAELRDRIAKIEGAFEKQKVISPGFENQDVIGMASEGGHADIQVLFIRNGMLLGRKDFYIADVHGMTNEEVLTDFLHQFYAKEMIVPAEVLLPFEVPDRACSRSGSRKSAERRSRSLCRSAAGSASSFRWPRTTRPSRSGSNSCHAGARSGSC